MKSISQCPEGFKDVSDPNANGKCYVHLSMPIAICTDDDGSGPELYAVGFDDKENEADRTPQKFTFISAVQ